MKGVLPDVNLLLASAWETHGDHVAAREWLINVERFSTCPITELGFVRVSMSPAYAADFADAIQFLSLLHERENAQRISDDFNVIELPSLSRYKDTTDAYLAKLAESHGMGLATLDRGILDAAWAKNVAFNPLEVSDG